MAVGYKFYKGAEDEPNYDVVIYEDNYYSCVKSHVKTASNYPTSDDDNNNGYWQLADKIEITATKLLLATYALVKNLGVEVIEMKDASGNTVFLAKDGIVTCQTGTFNNITVQSGTIAGFKVSGNGLTNDPFTNDAYIIFRNDSKKAFAGIGGNVLPTSSGLRAMARFENEDTSDQWGIGANYALILSAKNAARNYAFIGSGNGILDGYIAGFSFHKYTIAAANTIYQGDLVLNLKKSNQFIVHCEYGNSGVCLPKLNAVCESLGIKSGTNFCLKITIISDLSNTQNWSVYGRNKKKSSSNTYPWNTEQLPLLTHWDGSNWDDCAMGSGDSLQIMLVYDSSRTQTINGYTTKYTARIINRQN
ncbi:hypothetical protein CIL02_08725 [Prevotella sp. P3-122]|nr:hypothetical protein CIL02_08725 [Prevotella sp. P3-122]